MKKIVSFIATALLSLSLFSCEETKDFVMPSNNLEVNPTEAIEFTALGGMRTLTISSEELWVVNSSEAWCKLDKTNGIGSRNVSITVDENLSDARTAKIQVISGRTEITVLVNQVKRERPLSDRERLMAFYKATNGDGWKTNTGWGTDAPMSGWFGIKVSDTDAEKITHIELSENNLRGELPKEIFGLESLIALELGNNKLSGEIPTELGDATKLELFSILNNSGMTGSIPASIGNLQYLRYFSCWNDAGVGKLTGPIPAEIGGCDSLHTAYFYGNKFNGNLPATFGKLKHLELLYLRQNELTGPIPAEFGDMESLVQLELGVNKLSGEIPAALGKLKKLGYLYLKECQFTGTLPKELFFPGCPLYSLNVRSNKLGGDLPVEFKNATALKSIMLFNNDFTGTLPAEMKNFTQLTEMRVENNRFTGVIPTEIKGFAGYNKANFVFSPQQANFGFSNASEF